MTIPWFLGNNFSGFLFPLMFWSLAWTGLALWYASQRKEKWWFIFFLVVHTAGIVEILYLIFIAKTFSQPSSSTKKRRRS